MRKHIAGLNITPRSLVIVAWLMVGWTFASLDVSAQRVSRHPDSEDALVERWDWAVSEGARETGSGGYWIGYSISRLMGEHSFLGNSYHSDRHNSRSLNEIVHGIRLEGPESVRRAVRRVLDDLEKPERRVIKDVAILFRFRSEDTEVRKVVMGNMSMDMNLDDLPLFWLGEAVNEQSLALLQDQYERSVSDETRKDLIRSVGIHQDADRVIPFLESILTGNESSDIRKSASYGLGNQDDTRALRILLRAVENDQSGEVSKSAVYAIGNLELDGATDALLEILDGRGDFKVEVRKAALYALGNRDEQTALSALRTIALREDETELQKAAVYALSNHMDESGVEPLLEILRKSGSTEIRKAVVYAIGNHESKSAVDALREVIRDERSSEVRKAAVYALGNIGTPGARKALAELLSR